MAGHHNTPDKLASAHFPDEGKDTYIPGVGYLRAWGAATPDDEGYAKGCLFQNTTDGKISANEGTETTASWEELAIASDLPE